MKVAKEHLTEFLICYDRTNLPNDTFLAEEFGLSASMVGIIRHQLDDDGVTWLARERERLIDLMRDGKYVELQPIKRQTTDC